MTAPASLTESATEALAEQAAHWDMRLRSPACTAADREDFAEWCAQDTEHGHAFDELQLGVRGLKEAYAASPRLRAMRDRAHALRPAPRPWRIAAAIGAIAIGVAGVAVWKVDSDNPASRIAAVEVPRGAPSIYQTAVGERTTVTLSDGSKVTLNTRSRMVVSYAADRRDVTLVAGQALFEVAHNAARPFVVTAGSRKVTAVGTAFDVRLDPQQVRVTMIEGKVKVERARSPVWRALVPDARSLVAGQQMTASNQSADATVRQADIATETSWRDGVVVFDDEPLSQAVAEINRYALLPIVVGDAQLSQFRVNGRFRTGEPSVFVGAVTAYFPVEAQVQPNGETVLVARR